jgi:hypothetical protein
VTDNTILECPTYSDGVAQAVGRVSLAKAVLAAQSEAAIIHRASAIHGDPVGNPRRLGTGM